MDRLLQETAERIFADHVTRAAWDDAESGIFPAALWAVVEKAGLHKVGGADSGTGWDDLFGLLTVAGRHAVPLPLAEMLLAGTVVADANAAGFTTIAAGGLAPWPTAARQVLSVEGQVSSDFGCVPASNLAGEPFAWVELLNPRSVAVPRELPTLLAVSRVALMAGALERVLEMCIAHATEREQFGRPIAKFQAVQHGLAVLAGEVAAAGSARDGCVAACGTPRFVDEAAAAKARVGEAAGIGAELAHQVHGAMGFTHEHDLHRFTRRLWAWRDEHGHETVWQTRLGRRVAAGGADRVWDFIVGA